MASCYVMFLRLAMFILMLRVISVIFILFPLATYSNNNSLSIENIFVQAEGNNQIEAKIRAYDMGMRRALHIIADKMGVHNGKFDDVSQESLENAFTIAKVRDANFDGSWYSASINYEYNTRLVNEIVLKIAEKYEPNALFSCLFIPVFKQKSIISLWNQKNPWLSYWDKIAPTIEEKKLLYPKDLIISGSDITPRNVFTVSYDTFLTLLPNKLFKHVVLAVAEYFTTEDGQTYLKIDYTTINAQGRTTDTKKYNIYNKADVNKVVIEAANDLINKMGVTSVATSVDDSAKSPTPGDNLSSLKIDKLSEYIMQIDLYNSLAIEQLKAKLKSTKSIQHFIINHNQGEQYTVIILTRDNIEKLTYNLYLNGLTYSKTDSVYHLMQDTSGI